MTATLGSPRGHGEQATYVTSDFFGERADDGAAVSGGEVAGGSFHPNLKGSKDEVGDLVGGPTIGVGDLNIQVGEDRAGHGSSFGTVTSGSIPESGAGRKGWDGDTSSPSPAPEVLSFDAEYSNQGSPGPDAVLTRKLRRAVAVGSAVRRLTPTECERLQGFPDSWTDLGGTPDSKRYAALGDAVTVPVAEWLGRRILTHLEGDHAR